MASKEPFLIDGINIDELTVEEILNLPSSVINKMSTRTLSRAVRTAALAANKRVKRLLSNSVKHFTGNPARPVKYEPKPGGKYIIDTSALNHITEDGNKEAKFGVSMTDGTKGSLHKELKRIKQFMDFETSTIKGASAVRKEREQRIMGTTQEDYIKKHIKQLRKQHVFTNKKQEKEWKKEIRNYFNLAVEKSYELFRRLQEIPELKPLFYQYGSTEAMQMIAQRTLEGDMSEEDEAELLEKVAQHYYDLYEAEQEAMHNTGTTAEDPEDVFNLKF